ncbi:MAG TPA: hypothetical protein VFX97_01485 [Pyrinomonadaceae bacterium]|nr:hypothetical protein [Pyrinomonadaceae bacterium]
MKRILSLLSMLVVFASCLVVASAQPKKRRPVTRGATGTGARARNPQSPKRAIGAGGAGTYVRNGQRGRYVTRNGKRIWVPQGSPVVEREQLDVKTNKPTSNTNRP